MNKTTLSHLETSAMIAFIEVAERGSFTAAAAALNLSQPTVSQQVQRLERVVGIKLLNRASNKVYLSEAGEVFILHCRTALQNMEIGITSAIQSCQPVTETVRLGLTCANTQRCLSPVLNYYQQHQPQMGIEIVECIPDALVAELHDRTLDVAIFSLPIPLSDLRVETLYEEPVFAVVAATHPLAAMSTVQWEDIGLQPVILPRQSSQLGLRAMVENLYRTHYTAITIAAEVNGYLSLRQLLLSKYGVAFLPYSQVKADVESGLLVIREVPDVSLTHTVAIATHPKYLLSPAAQNLATTLPKLLAA